MFRGKCSNKWNKAKRKSFFCAVFCPYSQIKYAIFCCVLDFFYFVKGKHCRDPPAYQFKKI